MQACDCDGAYHNGTAARYYDFGRTRRRCAETGVNAAHQTELLNEFAIGELARRRRPRRRAHGRALFSWPTRTRTCRCRASRDFRAQHNESLAASRMTTGARTRTSSRRTRRSRTSRSRCARRGYATRCSSCSGNGGLISHAAAGRTAAARRKKYMFEGGVRVHGFAPPLAVAGGGATYPVFHFADWVPTLVEGALSVHGDRVKSLFSVRAIDSVSHWDAIVAAAAAGVAAAARRDAYNIDYPTRGAPGTTARRCGSATSSRVEREHLVVRRPARTAVIDRWRSQAT